MTPEDEAAIAKVRTAIKLVQTVRVTEGETLSEFDDNLLGTAVRDVYLSRRSEFQDLVRPAKRAPEEVQTELEAPGFENLIRAYQLLEEVKEDQSSLSSITLNLSFNRAPVVIRNVYQKYEDG